MTFMNGPHCTVLRSQMIQLLGSKRGMERNAMTTNGAMIKNVMNTATFPTIESPLCIEEVSTPALDLANMAQGAYFH